ncbi:MAG TPA: 2Fe-2S iron-sulfur cluster-binding protein [Solirubrobacteraceae bacterium]|nr:2Fe-2S iron-sulfur cluster-binding protein [Solirubrobacteraceae bacterium]
MRIRFEPLGEEIDCAAGETVLDAAFRQGYNLAHGCREGQCSACKCYLLDGEVDLARYSSFALSDTERSGGYALMCRAMPESDVTVELLHYDPDNYRLENPISERTARVASVTDLTAEVVMVTLTLDQSFTWVPGQYVDVHVAGATRSFSIANLPNRSGPTEVELIVRRYPGGRVSGLFGTEIVSGSEVRLTGPYGALRLRDPARPMVMIAAGSGLGPVLALLRELAARDAPLPRVYFAAREPFLLDELRGLGCEPVLVSGRQIAEALDDVQGDHDVYMCGPPGLIDAAEAALTERGIYPSRIFTDRFTTAAEAVASEAAAVTRETTEREFQWFAPAGRRATLYEDVTIDTQPSIHRHLSRGWPLSFGDGRGTWNDASTALRCTDWFAFRDPGGQWERTFYQAGTAVEHQLESALASAAEQGLIADFRPDWVQFLRTSLQIPAFVEHGLWFALATAARDCLSDSVATCVCLQAAHKQRSAQAIVLYAMDLEPHLGCELPVAQARDAFLHDRAWQPTRRYLERLAATPDWGEVIIAGNLCFEPMVGTLIRRELGTRAAAASGDTVTPVLARAATEEWEWARAWTRALVRFLVSDATHREHNRAVIDGWLGDWMAQAWAAASAISASAHQVGDYAERIVREALDTEGTASSSTTRPAAPRPAAPLPNAGADGAAPAGADGAADDDAHDYVGIVMAKSAEGDALARFFAGSAEIIEQPAFWEIRAPHRLVIPYDEVSEELGYDINAYSIQHEMSTHYGRMVATDDALMLFSDPTEGMEHLLS